MSEYALLEHSRDVVGRALARSAVDAVLGSDLHLHQAEGFALVANVAEDAAGLLHHHGQYELTEQDLSIGRSLKSCSGVTHGSIPAEIATDEMAEMMLLTVPRSLPRLIAGLLMARSSSQDSHANGKRVPLKQ